MIKKINDFLAGWMMTIVGGVFLLASFILPRTGQPWGENLAWVCVVICGIPLLYLAVWRIIYNRGISKISSALLISMAMIAAICMIGDGVNDAPALKTADAGVTMGAMGSDIAVDASDVALMDDNISKLPYLKWLSNTTITTIKGAIALSMCINFAAVTLSVLGVLNPTTGALVHNAGSTLVVLLAALLYDRKYKYDL